MAPHGDSTHSTPRMGKCLTSVLSLRQRRVAPHKRAGPGAPKGNTIAGAKRSGVPGLWGGRGGAGATQQMGLPGSVVGGGLRVQSEARRPTPPQAGPGPREGHAL